MKDLYVNSDSTSAVGEFWIGSDDNNGLDPETPTLTIAAAIAKNITGPVTEAVTIHLAVPENPSLHPYEKDAVNLDLSSLDFRANGVVTIIPGDWDVDTYHGLMNPFEYEGSPPPPGLASVPLPILPPVLIGAGGRVNLFGLHMRGEVEDVTDLLSIIGGIVVALSGGNLMMDCCRVVGGRSGLALWRSNALVMNSYFVLNQVGVLAFGGAKVGFFGDNLILNPNEIGLCVANHSTALVASPGSDQSPGLAIITTAPRSSYSAVKAMLHSEIILDGKMPGFGGQPWPGFIHILRDSQYDNEGYRGVVLESSSLLLGARNVHFKRPVNFKYTADPLADTIDVISADSVEAGRQFIVASEHGAAAID